MSTHPNTLIVGVITVDGTSRKTLRAMQGDEWLSWNEALDSFKIGKRDFTANVMEEDYDQNGYQISAPEGSIVLHTYLTYGYGETVEWEEVVSVRDTLNQWLTDVCDRHGGSHKIILTANYW